MTATTMIANLGGMLGLCMGFSLISIMEIIFLALSLLNPTIRK